MVNFFSSLLFFVSSRSRHTRAYGDWSSDVCSSDLDEDDGGGEDDGETQPLEPAESLEAGQDPHEVVPEKAHRDIRQQDVRGDDHRSAAIGEDERDDRRAYPDEHGRLGCAESHRTADERADGRGAARAVVRDPVADAEAADQ